MANRFWVGGTGNWNNSSTANWASSSGGASGASYPTSADSVTIDANSGTGTITITTSVSCLTFNTTGSSASLGITGGAGILNVYGSLTAPSGAATTQLISVVVQAAGTFTASTSFTPGSCTFAASTTMGAAWAVSGTTSVSLNSGTLTLGAYAHAFVSLTSSGSANISSTSGSSITINDSGTSWNWGSSATPAGSGPATLYFTKAGATTFAGGSKSYANFTLSPAVDVTLTITGSNTFAALSSTTSGAGYYKLTDGTTTTVTSLSFNGTAGNLFRLSSSTGTATATLSCASGSQSVSYADISYSIVTGGASFTAVNSTDSGNNTGWSFGGGANTLFMGANF